MQTQFNDSILHLCDFHLADLTNARITKEQLQMNSYNMAILPNGTEASNESLIDLNDKCLLNNWIIYPRKSIDLTEECYFIAKKDNVTIKHQFSLYLYQRLIQRQEALFQFAV